MPWSFWTIMEKEMHGRKNSKFSLKFHWPNLIRKQCKYDWKSYLLWISRSSIHFLIHGWKSRNFLETYLFIRIFRLRRFYTSSKSVDELCQILSSELRNLNEYLCERSLLLNPQKTQFLVLRSSMQAETGHTLYHLDSFEYDHYPCCVPG